jgi:hypothetical protein
MAEKTLDDLIEEWHNSGPEETRPLHEFLGMTWEEYGCWVKTLVTSQGD